MKIDNISQLPGTQAVGERKSGDNSAAATGDSAAAESSNVSQLRRPAADNSRDIDSTRVAEIRQAIADGHLEIRADRIADGLVDSVREMLGTQEQ
ncbi:flagellar biosynthesis anti-sigma factor FlgM [Microbulbifer litoralis]|uniref:flagellar biosynthesis anti-sigma factor FlgM n=1 Tax=Microbulbifer litoralis TaxID=2933965 RepID=UPI0020293695|nr:flagellar biosynthesis anti-sigma factor FlgM [Microbulbifer sp. GX H0434]